MIYTKKPVNTETALGLNIINKLKIKHIIASINDKIPLVLLYLNTFDAVINNNNETIKNMNPDNTPKVIVITKGNDKEIIPKIIKTIAFIFALNDKFILLTLIVNK